MAYDIYFKNATIVDGIGNDSYVGDVAIKNDMIEKIGKGEGNPSGQIFDATGLVLCPGFIDIHAHSELEVLRDPSMAAKIGQGITTEVSGNCGIGVFPVKKDDANLYGFVRDVLGSYPSFGWKDFSRYLSAVEEKGNGTNMAFLQSHSALRCYALEGNPNRSANSVEVKEMCSLLEESYKQGCLGFSSGLYYAPCLFAGRGELIALLEVTKRYDRLFAVHIRCEGDDVIEALQEVLELAKYTGVRLEVSHLKAIGRNNQLLISQMLSMIETARLDGLDVLFDQYPYEYGSTSLFSLLPPQYLRLERGDLQTLLGSPKEREAIKAMMKDPQGWDSLYELCGWDNITAITMDSNSQYEGLTFTEIANRRNQGPFEAFFDLLKEEKGSAVMTDITESQESLKKIMTHPLMCFGTDALYAGEKCHPRSFQAAIHFIDKYWKQKQVMSLEQMIYKMTGETASRLGLSDRGRVKEGYKADLVLFDPKIIKDNSSASNPKAKPDGLLMVLVNGKIALNDGTPTHCCAGVILKA
ncbi:D-aminoacylase [uncultured Sphaerochaeta sp.]|uniref:N-acyl-D-amino-acid deacylase family protein n=1 Tax=uncultured Sphaerochaeta sp. TaxID=886478 RepID=UPI002A0A2F33|nr:D-aminoacylase [uncultured Sphaerochaeta sp.]